MPQDQPNPPQVPGEIAYQEREKHLQEKRNRRRFLSMGLLIGTIIGVPVILSFIWIGGSDPINLAVGILISLIIVGLILFLVIRYKDKILSSVFGNVKANNEMLVEAAFKAVDAIGKKEQDHEAFRENSLLLVKGLVARYSWMQFQRWLFSTALVLVGGFAGLLGSVLLYQQLKRLDTQNQRLLDQNKLLTSQNDLVSKQNALNSQQVQIGSKQLTALETQNQLFGIQNQSVQKQTGLFNAQNSLFREQNTKVDSQTLLFQKQYTLAEAQIKLANVQTYLLEADRRSSLVHLFNNVLDQIDAELKDPKNEDRTLSPQTIGRVVALSGALKPYRYLEDSILTEKKWSPERAQLLISLYGAELDSITMTQIAQQGDFSYADFPNGTVFYGADFTGIKLRDANLSGADLSGANLKDANLFGADLSGANLKDANLFGADLFGADLSGADLSGADLSGAKLSAADLSDADLRDADLRDAKLWGADLRGADLSDADLSSAKLGYAKLWGAFLGGANLHRADLISATLNDVYLYDANLSSASLIGAKLIDTNLRYAKLFHADLRGAKLFHADLRGAVVDNINWIQGLKSLDFLPEELKYIEGKYQVIADSSLGEIIYKLKEKETKD